MVIRWISRLISARKRRKLIKQIYETRQIVMVLTQEADKALNNAKCYHESMEYWRRKCEKLGIPVLREPNYHYKLDHCFEELMIYKSLQQRIELNNRKITILSDQLKSLSE